MMKKQALLEGILLHLYSQAPGDVVPLAELCEKLGVSSREPVVEALDKLEAQGYVKVSALTRLAMLCEITYKGRKIVKDLRQDSAESAEDREFPPSSFDEPNTEATEESLDFSWTLDKLDAKHVYVVQRQNVIERIQTILDDPVEGKIVFVYGQPQVGKTFVLNQLRETLQGRYVSVHIHVNGWLSISSLSEFLYELACCFESELLNIGYQIASFTPGVGIEATAEFSRFMNKLVQSMQEERKILLLMFDELEYLVREETDKRIFEYLTGCADTYCQQVKFIFAGSGHLLDMLKHGPLTTLWAKGESVHIDCFDKETSLDLVIGQTSRYFAFETGALDRIVYLADGHPRLLKSMLGIIIRHWRSEWRKDEITDADLSSIIEDVCIELSPTLKNIWYRLPSSEKRVLQLVARNNKRRFKTQEIIIGTEPGIESCLDQLVKRQILDYNLQDKLYTVRLGLLIESISCYILSVYD